MVVAWLSSISGVEDSALRLLLGIFAGYPLAIVWRLLPPTPSLKHLFSFLSGLSISIFCYGSDAYHHFLCTLVTYLILVAIPSRKISLALAWIFNVSYLMVAYYIYSSAEVYNINWTTAGCVLTLRMIGFAFDVADGRLKREVLDKDQQRNALPSVPPFLAVLGFSYHFGGMLVGPQFNFALYNQFVEGSLVPIDRSYPVLEPIRCFALGLFYIGLAQAGAIFFNPEVMLSPAFLQSKNILEKIFWTTISMRFNVWKYVGVWKLGEGPNIVSGLGYNGVVEKTGESQWDGVTNVHSMKFDLSTSLNDVIANFNINTNNWVKLYVFKRLRFLGNKDLSQLGALFFLALWHGHFIGYFVCFFMEFLDMQALYMEQKWTAPYLDPIYNNPRPTLFHHLFKFIYSALCMAVTSACLSYGAIAFHELQWHKLVRAWSAVNWWGHWLVLAVFVLNFVAGLIFPKKKASSKKD